jgi:hypothetical protein
MKVNLHAGRRGRGGKVETLQICRLVPGLLLCGHNYRVSAFLPRPRPPACQFIFMFFLLPPLSQSFIPFLSPFL